MFFNSDVVIFNVTGAVAGHWSLLCTLVDTVCICESDTLFENVTSSTCKRVPYIILFNGMVFHSHSYLKQCSVQYYCSIIEHQYRDAVTSPTFKFFLLTLLQFISQPKDFITTVPAGPEVHYRLFYDACSLSSPIIIVLVLKPTHVRSKVSAEM